MTTAFLALIVMGLVSHPTQRPPTTGPGVIAGAVVDAQRVPVADATVQAFPAPAGPSHERAPFTTSAVGQATTDAQGRFRISGLPIGEYLVGARVRPSPPSNASQQTPLYVETFYPSTGDHQAAVSVPALADATPIQIALAQVKGVRISGTVVTASGLPAAGMAVRLFHRFGGEGSESTVGEVGANGTFETPRLPPGWYQLTIGTRSSESENGGTEFATTLLEVQDRDLDGLSLVLGSGASISGRIVAEAGAAHPSSLGMRVSASPVSERYVMAREISARAGSDGSFHMTGLSGFYQFSVSAERQPFVQTTHVAADGRESPVNAGVEL